MEINVETMASDAQSFKGGLHLLQLHGLGNVAVHTHLHAPLPATLQGRQAVMAKILTFISGHLALIFLAASRPLAAMSAP
jgi:hypothetical protein